MSLVGFNCPKLTLSMRVVGPRNSAYAFWDTTDIPLLYIRGDSGSGGQLKGGLWFRRAIKGGTLVQVGN